MLDYFYSKQEPSGAIRGEYSIDDGTPVLSEGNPEGIHPPLFALVEYNLYHKVGNKKRLKEIVPVLERYLAWLEKTCKQENGLYSVPLEATLTENMPREDVVYPVDFNALMAVNTLYMSAIGDILNDKELSFRYKRQYFSFKTRINSLMWNADDGFYYDLDGDEHQVQIKTIGTYWTLLAEIPNEDRAEQLIELLKDPEGFGTENPFPTIAVSEKAFSENGNGFCGSIIPAYTFMVIKGLERYKEYEFARECAIRHLYFILDTLHPDGTDNGDVYEAYLPFKEGPAEYPGKEGFPRRKFLPMIGLVTVTLMIENIIGLSISLPRKTVDWIMPTLEAMGIEDLSLKRNLITILSNKNSRGWEIRLESEKLYYFTIDILDEKKKKTLPIPSGKCSMLIDKL
jgi:neutral trehalase